MSDLEAKCFVILNSRMTFLESLSVKNTQTYKSFGGRISALLAKNEIVNNPNTVGVLDDLLGAIYCLNLAEYHEFEDRTNKPIEIHVIQTRATQIQNGEVRIDGKWIAGWHFNSAIYRISSTYHRLLQLITNSSGDIGHLIANAKIRYKNWAGVEWNEADVRKVQKEVNKLKHKIEGVYFKRNVTFQQTLDSIANLLDLIESWSKAHHTT